MKDFIKNIATGGVAGALTGVATLIVILLILLLVFGVKSLLIHLSPEQCLPAPDFVLYFLDKLPGLVTIPIITFVFGIAFGLIYAVNEKYPPSRIPKQNKPPTEKRVWKIIDGLLIFACVGLLITIIVYNCVKVYYCL